MVLQKAFGAKANYGCNDCFWFFKKHVVQKQIMVAIIVSGHGGEERGKGRRGRRRVFHVIERVSQREMSLRHSIEDSTIEDMPWKMSPLTIIQDL